jgi:hypothetical protein
MNKSKIIAGIIFLAVFFGPFQMLFITDEVVDGGKFIALFMATIVGFFAGFGIATNEPFNRKNVAETQMEIVEDSRIKDAA